MLSFFRIWRIFTAAKRVGTAVEKAMVPLFTLTLLRRDVDVWFSYVQETLRAFECSEQLETIKIYINPIILLIFCSIAVVINCFTHIDRISMCGGIKREHI